MQPAKKANKWSYHFNAQVCKTTAKTKEATHMKWKQNFEKVESSKEEEGRLSSSI